MTLDEFLKTLDTWEKDKRILAAVVAELIRQRGWWREKEKISYDEFRMLANSDNAALDKIVSEGK